MISISRLRTAAALDLHSHSLHSDGSLAPCEVARRMVQAGVGTGALSDHDTMAGVPEFGREAARHGMKCLPAVELTCACAELLPLRDEETRRREAAREAGRTPAPAPTGPVEVHLLVYGIPPGQAELEELMARIRAMRRGRVAAMAARLAELGLPLDLSPLAARLETGSVGRPHLARLLVAEGRTASINESFQKWLADGRPAWLPKQLPELREALRLAQGLGGVAIAAHPGKTLPPSAALTLIDLGVDGLEARHPSHRAAMVQELHDLCRRNRLSASAGSDFHDPRLGRYHAPLWRPADVGGRLQDLLAAL